MSVRGSTLCFVCQSPPVFVLKKMINFYWIALFKLLLFILIISIPYKASSEELHMIIMPKLLGINYYDAVKKGIDEAVAELPDLRITWAGPRKDLVDDQISLMDSLLSDKTDLVAVAANDPVTMGEYLKKISDSGINVMTWDADAAYREFFVNLVDFDEFAEHILLGLVDEIGTKGNIVIITTSFTAPNQSSWIKSIKQLLFKRYPDINLYDIRPAGESTEEAYRVTLGLLNTTPDISAIIVLGVPNVPGVAKAVKELGMSGKVAVLGNSTPNLMRPYLKDGTVKSVFLWDAKDHGYLTTYSAYRLLKKKINGTQPFNAGRLGMVYPIQDKQNFQVHLPVKVFTIDNVDDYDF